MSLEWNDARNIGSCLNAEAGSTKRILKRPFLPYLFPRKGKDMAVGDNRQLQSRYNLSVSAAPSQLPWKGRQGFRTARGTQMTSQSACG